MRASGQLNKTDTAVTRSIEALSSITKCFCLHTDQEQQHSSS